MLYAVTYDFEAISSPSGYATAVRKDALAFAVSMAEIALERLDDAVNFAEWLDIEGNERNPRELLTDPDENEVVNIMGQIGERLSLEKLGHLKWHEHHDLFQMVQVHDVESWCSSDLVERIAEVRRRYDNALRQLADEWLES